MLHSRNLVLVVFFLDLPVPIYWFILHPFSSFWSRHIRAAFFFAGLASWTLGAIFVVFFRHLLLAPAWPSIAIVLAGLALVCLDFVLLYYSGKFLGHRKLVGHAELAGKTELTTTGLYRYVRHPRYTGMIAAVGGACLLANTRFAWIVGAVWLALVLASIFLEEREMRHRFGIVYENYSHTTARFIPKIF